MKKYLYYLITALIGLMLPLTTACGGSDDKVGVTGVTLSPAAMTLSVGQTQSLAVNVQPDNATNKDVTWSSSSAGVAAVSNNGTVTAVAPGSATITVTTADGGQTAVCSVTVTPVAVTGVTLSQTSMALPVGASQQLTATVSPNNAANKDVTWSSSNMLAANVINGAITAVSPGQATITATTVSGNRSASCVVTVIPAAYPNPVTGVTLTPAALTIFHGDTYALTATVSPGNATNSAVTWSSSNFAVASVSNGNIKAAAPGQATITVTTADGGKTAVCAVTVNPVRVTGISLKPKILLGVGSGALITPILEPANATDKTVTWTSNNATVASVSDDGFVECLAKGSAIITARAQDGGFEASAELSSVNIYAGGEYFYSTDYGYGFGPAVMVENQTQIHLSEEQIDAGVNGAVNALFVTEAGDYYAAGADDDNPGHRQQARLWKNGELYMNLSMPENVADLANGLAKSGNDIYVSGMALNNDGVTIPMLWKNSEPQELEIPDPYSDTGAYAVAVSDSGDVYAAGQMDLITIGDIGEAIYSSGGILWINGKANILNQTEASLMQVTSIAISGKDVYLACVYADEYEYYPDYNAATFINQRALIWKNGEMEFLEDPPLREDIEEWYLVLVSSISVVGEDVYVAGTATYDVGGGGLNSIPVYWKNGECVAIKEGYGEIYSMFVIDDTVFLAGYRLEPIGAGWSYLYPGLWVDGVSQNISDGRWQSFYSIFVTK